MAAPPGNRLTLNFSEALSPPSGSAVGLNFTSSAPTPIGVGVGSASIFGLPSVRKPQFIRPSGWFSGDPGYYYSGKHSIERASLRIEAQGWAAGAISAPTYVRWRKFVTPEGVATGDWVPPASLRYAGGYQPAPGSSILLNFSEPLNPPPGGAVVLEFGAMGYTGVLGATAGATAAFGAHAVTKPGQIRPSSLGQLSAFGTPKLEGSVRYVSLSLGIAPPAAQVGTPEIENRAREVKAGGIVAPSVGALTIWHRNRTLAPAGLLTFAAGTPRIEHGVRRLLAVGSDSGAFGTLRISYREQRVNPASIWQEFASAHMIGTRRWLLPVGFDSARFGTRIIPEIQQVYPQGFVSAFGTATLQNLRQTIKPPSVGWAQPADRWGIARLYNLRQYITQLYDADSGLVPPAWPAWTAIANRNRHVGPTGRDTAAFGYTQIDNNARPMIPSGIDHIAPSSGVMIAARVRHIQPEPMEAPYLSGWNRIHNDGRVLGPAGAITALFGAASLANTRRYFKFNGFDSAWFGYPMVADRIRTLTFESRYGIAPPAIPLPGVKLHTRHVSGIGTDMARIGWASLEIHWTRILPRWTLQNLYGSPTVRNLTPEVGTRGRNSEEFGDALVRLQWRPVNPEGTNTALIGRASIADKKRRLTLNGIQSALVSDKLTVVKTGAPPYSQQSIVLDAIEGVTLGYGIAPPNYPNSQCGTPSMQQQVVYVRQNDPSTLFGTPRITANSIRVEPGYWDLLVGEPMVALKVRRLTVEKFPDEQVYAPSRARVSPHTIYAMTEAPQQAKENHPTSIPLHPIDGYLRSPGAIFGTATLALRHRIIRAGSGYHFGSGMPSIDNKRRYIQPAGFSTMRFGWHSIPGLQTIEPFDPEDALAFGSTTVGRGPYYGPQTVSASGLSATAFGALWASLYRREIRPSGLQATAMGASKGDDTPYMWQGLRAGPLMPTIPAGFDSSRLGDAWISHRVRETRPDGFDAFASDYDIEAFEQRMRVWRRASSGSAVKPSQTVTPVGILAFAAAASDIRPAAHYIRPDGNNDQFRKGAF